MRTFPKIMIMLSLLLSVIVVTDYMITEVFDNGLEWDDNIGVSIIKRDGTITRYKSLSFPIVGKNGILEDGHGLLVLPTAVKDLADEVRHLPELAVDHLDVTGRHAAVGKGQAQGYKRGRNHLGSIRLGGGNSHLGTSLHVECTIGLTCGRAPQHVGDREDQIGRAHV